MFTRKNNNTKSLSEKSISLLGRQYKIIDRNLRFVSSGLQENGKLFHDMSLKIFAIQDVTNHIAFAHRGLND
jgi:hypothetical protein